MKRSIGFSAKDIISGLSLFKLHPRKHLETFHLALFSLRIESDNPDATCELSP